jgi:hypothetical protein
VIDRLAACRRYGEYHKLVLDRYQMKGVMRGQNYSLNDSHAPVGAPSPEDSSLRAGESKCRQPSLLEKPKRDEQKSKR